MSRRQLTVGRTHPSPVAERLRISRGVWKAVSKICPAGLKKPQPQQGKKKKDGPALVDESMLQIQAPGGSGLGHVQAAWLASPPSFLGPSCKRVPLLPPLHHLPLKAEVYQDFNPLKLKQSEGSKVIEFQTFDASLDEFYSKAGGPLGGG